MKVFARFQSCKVIIIRSSCLSVSNRRIEDEKLHSDEVGHNIIHSLMQGFTSTTLIRYKYLFDFDFLSPSPSLLGGE